jgi:hypothetical protein
MASIRYAIKYNDEHQVEPENRCRTSSEPATTDQESVGPGKAGEHQVRPAMTNIKWDQRFDVGGSGPGNTPSDINFRKQTRNDNGVGAAGPLRNGHFLTAQVRFDRCGRRQGVEIVYFRKSVVENF